MSTLPTYNICKVNDKPLVNGCYNKFPWINIEPIKLINFMGEMPSFKPEVEVKICYDIENIYGIFRVQDKFIISSQTKINSNVWQDSCVEFFFSPNPTKTHGYFNLEINAGGTPLLHYNIIPRKDVIKIEEEDIKKIIIAGSLPPIIKNEIKDEVCWIMEFAFPLDIIKRYTLFEFSDEEIVWKAGFFKTAEATSNPHYLSWVKIPKRLPDFHLPEYFGSLHFI